jgi:hypothetical protein
MTQEVGCLPSKWKEKLQYNQKGRWSMVEGTLESSIMNLIVNIFLWATLITCKTWLISTCRVLHGITLVYMKWNHAPRNHISAKDRPWIWQSSQEITMKLKNSNHLPVSQRSYGCSAMCTLCLWWCWYKQPPTLPGTQKYSTSIRKKQYVRLSGDNKWVCYWFMSLLYNTFYGYCNCTLSTYKK